MKQHLRRYEPSDLDAVARIWREVGWIDDDDEDKAALADFMVAGDAEVAEVRGSAECMVHRTSGSMQYQETPLPLCAISAVTTSLVGRRQGFASILTARALAQGHAAGAAVSALGMFDQGFYDRFGFATAAYDNEFSFDPATLAVGHVPYRTPVRLTTDDAADFHQALHARWLSHGAVLLDPPAATSAEMAWTENLVGLGYRDDAGVLTHGFFGTMKGEEHGPLRITAFAYQDSAQLLELLRLVRELGDQIRTVSLMEPAHIQLQALLLEPMRQRNRTRASIHANQHRAFAWMQLRLLDLTAGVAARDWAGPEVAFNLTLTDPLAGMDGGWAGLGGDYTVTVGSPSRVEPGHRPGLAQLDAGIAAFTRLWFGVAPATSLVATDQLTGPDELFRSLDEALRLPALRAGCDF